MTNTPSLEALAAELRPHHNEICLLHDDQLVRLIGVGADDHDLYYIVQERTQRHRRGSVILWASAVGHIRPLKALMPEEDYARMETIFALNGCKPAPEFTVKDTGIWDIARSTLERRISRCGRFLLTFDRDRPDNRFALWRAYPDAPQAAEALILWGESAVLDDLAHRMIAEMDDWAAGRAQDAATQTA